jgi:hypothetical protein
MSVRLRRVRIFRHADLNLTPYGMNFSFEFGSSCYTVPKWNNSAVVPVWRDDLYGIANSRGHGSFGQARFLTLDWYATFSILRVLT